MAELFIVEDHAVVRKALIALITRQDGLVIHGEAATAEEALQQLAQYRPDLVLVDVSLPDMNGLELIVKLLQTQPDLPCLVVSGHNESSYGRAAMDAGARGYVTKHDVRNIPIAIRHVLDGGMYFSDQLRSGSADQSFS